MAFLNSVGLERLWAHILLKLSHKVDKVEGKDLSTNDFTDEYKTKLDDLENMTFEETDPTVPAWAKEATKPTYTADEVGAASKTELEAIIDDTQSTETNTWSSSKITSYIEETFLGGAW